ncbi:MAG: hypothetical protein H0Z38_09945 [Firmicutes bacterium]|nr:hypothetical protein [Bacillota bacterium]
MKLRMVSGISPEFAPFGKVISAPRGVDLPNWAREVFRSTYPEVSELEVKTLELGQMSSKDYTRLEIHYKSPQAFVITKGKIAVPVAAERHGSKVIFVEGEANSVIFVNPGIWHGGPFALADASLLVLLAKGTGESDTIKQPLEEPIVAEVC